MLYAQAAEAESVAAEEMPVAQSGDAVVEEEPPLDVSAEESESVPGTDVSESEEEEGYRIHRQVDPERPCDRSLDQHEYEKSWYDDSQIYMNTILCEPAIWFDNFFASDRVFAEGVPGTYVRWRNDLSYDEREGLDFKMGLSFSVQLPGLQDRVRITFENEQDEDLRDISPDGDDGATNKLGLQLDVKENVRSKFNISVNLSPRIRLRYRYTYPVEPDITLRFTQELERDSGFNGSRSLFDFEKLLKRNRSMLFRSSTEAKLSEEFDGTNWLQAFVLYHRLNDRTSLSYEASMNGVTQPEDEILNYRLGVRLRKNFHREWLFYEIAPEMTWPILIDQEAADPHAARHSNWLIFFRLEVHFGNTSSKRYLDYFR